MNFADVTGQERVKATLLRQADGDRMPHALMLHGPQGVGKLPLALALAQYMLCECPRDGEPCGTCHTCKMMRGWGHLDMHFSFPVIKKKSTDNPTSDDFLTQWREQLNESPYFTQQQWLARIKAQNQQMQHFAAESDALQNKLSLKAACGGRRIVVVWLPEKMNDYCANKLLKLIEEPPSMTYFIMVSDEPDIVLPTIVSRSQLVFVPPIPEDDIARALHISRGIDCDEARYVAHIAHGSYTAALGCSSPDGDRKELLDLFVTFMRICYSARIKDMRAWSDMVAKLGREAQKHLLDYFQSMVRENFIYNFNLHESLNYMTREEDAFSKRFSPFINERNVTSIASEISLCQRDIEGNVNARMVFFDLTLKLAILLKK